MYRKGIAPAPQDFGLARFYYTQASEAGVAAAQHALGTHSWPWLALSQRCCPLRLSQNISKTMTGSWARGFAKSTACVSWFNSTGWPTPAGEKHAAAMHNMICYGRLPCIW